MSFSGIFDVRPDFRPPGVGTCFGHSVGMKATADMVAATELFSALKNTLQSGARSKEGSYTVAMTPDAHCSCHIGFFSNEQIICNLLHLVVQLTLFGGPKCTTDQSTEPPSEIEQRHLGWKADACCQETVCAAEASSQTPLTAEQRQRSNHSPQRRSSGVRIGGGYHLVHQEVFDECNAVRSVRSNNDSVKELSAQYRDEEAIYRSYDARPAYVHGAAPEYVSASRFHVSSVSKANPHHPLPEQLYRVLQTKNEAVAFAPDTRNHDNYTEAFDGTHGDTCSRRNSARTLLQTRSEILETTKMVAPGRLRPSSAGQLRHQSTGQLRPRSASCTRRRENV